MRPVRAEDPAGEPPKPVVYVPPVMDEISAKLLEAWEKKVNNPGRLGLKKIAFTVNVKFSDATTTKPYETSGTFKWTHDEGGQKTTAGWKNKVLGDVLGELGWPIKAFVSNFDPDSLKRSLSGTKLTAKSDGENTIVSISGKNEDNIKQFTFNKDGALVSTLSEILSADNKPLDAYVKTTVKQEGNVCLETGWTYSYNDPKQGMCISTVTIKHEKIGGFYLWSSVEEKMTRGGKPFGNIQMDFTGYKINDEVDK
jgi:hypothetical protein